MVFFLTLSAAVRSSPLAMLMAADLLTVGCAAELVVHALDLLGGVLSGTALGHHPCQPVVANLVAATPARRGPLRPAKKSSSSSSERHSGAMGSACVGLTSTAAGLASCSSLGGSASRMGSWAASTPTAGVTSMVVANGTTTPLSGSSSSPPAGRRTGFRTISRMATEAMARHLPGLLGIDSIQEATSAPPSGRSATSCVVSPRLGGCLLLAERVDHSEVPLANFSDSTRFPCDWRP